MKSLVLGATIALTISSAAYGATIGTQSIGIFDTSPSNTSGDLSFDVGYSPESTGTELVFTQISDTQIGYRMSFGDVPNTFWGGWGFFGLAGSSHTSNAPITHNFADSFSVLGDTGVVGLQNTAPTFPVFVGGAVVNGVITTVEAADVLDIDSFLSTGNVSGFYGVAIAGLTAAPDVSQAAAFGLLGLDNSSPSTVPLEGSLFYSVIAIALLMSAFAARRTTLVFGALISIGAMLEALTGSILLPSAVQALFILALIASVTAIRYQNQGPSAIKAA